MMRIAGPASRRSSFFIAAVDAAGTLIQNSPSEVATLAPTGSWATVTWQLPALTSEVRLTMSVVAGAAGDTFYGWNPGLFVGELPAEFWRLPPI